MPTVVTHAAVAVGFGRLWLGGRRLPLWFWLLSAGAAAAPDLDVVAWPLGIPYDPLWGHRGLSHSLAAALPAAFVLTGATRRYLGLRGAPLCVYLFAVIASHGLLDACTDGGPGVAFLAPFDTARYFFPWRPIRVSPIGLAFFSGWGA